VAIPAAKASQIYQAWMRRWHIARRFPQPDWSIVDLWVARALVAQGAPPAQVQAILRSGSPRFSQNPVLLAIHLLVLQRLTIRFTGRIILWVSFAAHASAHLSASTAALEPPPEQNPLKNRHYPAVRSLYGFLTFAAIICALLHRLFPVATLMKPFSVTRREI
jgi:hypothetical protein